MIIFKNELWILIDSAWWKIEIDYTMRPSGILFHTPLKVPKITMEEKHMLLKFYYSKVMSTCNKFYTKLEQYTSDK